VSNLVGSVVVMIKFLCTEFLVVSGAGAGGHDARICSLESRVDENPVGVRKICGGNGNHNFVRYPSKEEREICHARDGKFGWSVLPNVSCGGKVDTITNLSFRVHAPSKELIVRQHFNSQLLNCFHHQFPELEMEDLDLVSLPETEAKITEEGIHTTAVSL